jgi:hypothetical protein
MIGVDLLTRALDSAILAQIARDFAKPGEAPLTGRQNATNSAQQPPPVAPEQIAAAGTQSSTALEQLRSATFNQTLAGLREVDIGAAADFASLLGDASSALFEGRVTLPTPSRDFLAAIATATPLLDAASNSATEPMIPQNNPLLNDAHLVGVDALPARPDAQPTSPNIADASSADARAVTTPEAATLSTLSILLDATAHAPASDTLAMLLANPALSPTERAGVVASAILNAGMIPGWPAQPAYTVAGEAQKTMASGLAPVLTLTETDILTYLANMGVSGDVLEKLTPIFGKISSRKVCLLHLAVLLSAFCVVFAKMKSELDAIIEEFVRENAASEEDLIAGRADARGGRLKMRLD